jgi:hypothetical protein
LVYDVDDDGATETVAFAYRGVNYEIDLSEKSAAALDEVLAPYLANARRVRSKPTTPRRPAAKSSVPAGPRGPCLGEEQRHRGLRPRPDRRRCDAPVPRGPRRLKATSHPPALKLLRDDHWGSAQSAARCRPPLALSARIEHRAFTVEDMDAGLALGLMHCPTVRLTASTRPPVHRCVSGRPVSRTRHGDLRPQLREPAAVVPQRIPLRSGSEPPSAGCVGTRSSDCQCIGIGGPSTVISGVGCCAQGGGSPPLTSAARRAQWRSNPAGVQMRR